MRLASIVSLLAPPACWSCHAPAPPAESLCRRCRARLRFLGPDVRPLAGVPLWAAVAYDGPARGLIHGLKYRGAAGLADALATQMAANAPGELLQPRPTESRPAAAAPVAAPPSAPSSAVPAGLLPARVPAPSAPPSAAPTGILPALVPVPASPARARRRGYDQAALLAAALGRRTGLPVVACLTRTGGASQVGRGRTARMHALAGAIHARTQPPPRALLIDDVATTGATLAACSEALGAAGCAEVAALVYARTPGR